MVAKPVDLGHRRFATQGAAKEHFRAMLNRYDLSKKIDADDEEDLRALLARHPDHDKKIGTGIKGFFVHEAPDFSSRCFWLIRANGTQTDLSYQKCITSKKPSLRQDFAAACRTAVWLEIKQARVRFFKENADDEGMVQCEISGKPVLEAECHVDHKPPLTFQVLVETFINANALELSWNMLEKKKDAQSAVRFANRQLEERFADYHRRQARLRVLSSEANTGEGPKHRIRSPKNPITL